MDPQWAQFWANVVALGVAIGVPWRLHVMDRAERSRQQEAERAKEAAAKEIIAINLSGIAWDTYVKSQSLRANLQQLTITVADADQRFSANEKDSLGPILHAHQFRDSTKLSTIPEEIKRFNMPEIAESMGQIARIARGFDYAQEQQMTLLATGMLRVSSLNKTLGSQFTRLDQIDAACRESYDVIARQHGLRPFNRMVEALHAFRASGDGKS